MLKTAAFDEKRTVLVEPIICSDRRSTKKAEILHQTIGADSLVTGLTLEKVIKLGVPVGSFWRKGAMV